LFFYDSNESKTNKNKTYKDKLRPPVFTIYNRTVIIWRHNARQQHRLSRARLPLRGGTAGRNQNKRHVGPNYTKFHYKVITPQSTPKRVLYSLFHGVQVVYLISYFNRGFVSFVII